MSKKSAQDIDCEAADWVVAAEVGPLSIEKDRLLEAWLAEDPRCAGAFARLQALAQSTDLIGGHIELFDRSGATSIFTVPRRKALQFGAALAATVTVAIFGTREFLDRQGRYRTLKGETKAVRLDDGSLITLNTATEVHVKYSQHERSIDLLAGEALFDVSKDRARPFTVIAGETKVRAVGTSFTVKRLGTAPVQVLVREGTVEVYKPLQSELRPVLISANTQALSLLGQTQIATKPVASKDVRRALLWREGDISFEGQTLEQAAEEFARYSDTRIIIEDPDLAREEIAGLFRSNDPVAFARKIAMVLNARAQVEDGVVKLTR